MAKTHTRTSNRSSTTKGRSAKTHPSRSRSGGKITTDHEKIRQWAEQRGGHPATVNRSRKGEAAGILRIDFPDYRGGESLKEISWDNFFDKFDKEKLAFLYQEKTATGRPSRFGKFIDRKSARKQGRK